MCAWPRVCAVCIHMFVYLHVRGSEAGRGGMYQCVIAVAWLHTVHRARGHHVYLRGWGGEGTEKELKLSI